MVLTGGCHCGDLAYRLESPLGPVVNCHCSFCRRIHGAAFTTVALFPAPAVSWQPGSGRPAVFETALGNLRHFCGRCAAPLFNLSSSIPAGAVVIGSLAEEHQPQPWAHVNTESKAPWHPIRDELPRFLEWPDADEIRAMCRRHPGSWVPEPLLGPAPKPG